MLGLQPAREIEQQPLRGLHVSALIGASQDCLRPLSLAVAEILEDIAGLVDLTPLDESGIAEDRVHRLTQRLGAIEDDEQAAISAKAATLEIGQQALTDRGVLRRAVPQAERVFLAVGRNAQSHDETVIPDVHAVDHPGPPRSAWS